MIGIVVNDELYYCEDNCNLQNFLMQHQLMKPWCACAVNGNIISKSRYAAVILQPQDILQIIVPMQGG